MKEDIGLFRYLGGWVEGIKIFFVAILFLSNVL